MLLVLTVSMLLAPVAAATVSSRTGPDGLPPAPPTTGPEVVGGTAVPDGKYPFQAALLFQSGGANDAQRQFCGGSLISPVHVLTAAHCVDSIGHGPGQIPLADLRIVVGRTVLTSAEGQRRSAQAITVHPQWQPSTFRNDVALITLSRPVRGVRPLDLVPAGSGAFQRPGTVGTATGWGNTLAQPNDGTSFFPDRLQEVAVPVVSPQACAAAMTFDGVQYLDRHTMLCAGCTGRDTCQGDSGGPLFVRAGNGRFVQIGVTSWGVGCAAGFPGVYTKLSNRSIGTFILSTTARTTEPPVS